jgi:hypothetical protein
MRHCLPTMLMTQDREIVLLTKLWLVTEAVDDVLHRRLEPPFDDGA